MGDEGVGVHVVRYLEDRVFPENVTLLDGGTGGFHILGDMQDADIIVLIDASDDKTEPGTIRKLTPKFSSDYPTTLTAHDVGLKDMLDAFYFTGKSPEVTLFAVTIRPLTGDLTMDLSPEIDAVLPQLSELVYEEAIRYAKGGLETATVS